MENIEQLKQTVEILRYMLKERGFTDKRLDSIITAYLRGDL